jgi:hypothetical protein
MPRAGIEPTIPATKRQQTYALDRAVTGIGFDDHYVSKIVIIIMDFLLKSMG